MKKEGILRGIMLAAGFVAVIGILCSQPFFQSAKAVKITTEQSDEKKAEAFVQAPADAIPGHSVQVDDSSVFHLIASCFEVDHKSEQPPLLAEKLGQFLKILFRTVISPNAP